MSKIEVDQVDPQSGTTLTLGTSGDTITVPTGVTFDASNATTNLNYPLTTFSSTGIDDNATSTAVTIDSSQRVGIGTASPTYPLYVNGVTLINNNLVVTGGTDTTDRRAIITHDGSSMILKASGDSTNRNIIFERSGDGSTDETMRIDSSGHVIAPYGVTLGTAVGTYSASNTLNDYEEGTFTPGFTGTTGAPSGVSYFNRNGRYIKIGKQVSISMWLDLQSWSSAGTGTAIISGLPFTATNVPQGYHAIHIGYSSGFSSTNAAQTGFIQADTNTILLYKNSTSDARDNLASDVQASSMTGTEAIIISGTYFTG